MSDVNNFKTFLNEAKKHKLRFTTAFILMPIGVGLAVQGPAFVQKAIDDGFKTGNAEALIQFSLLFLGVVILEAITNTTVNVLIQSGGIRSLRELRKKLFIIFPL